MAEVPIVDFAPALDGTQQEKKEVARQIDDAFRTVGFVYLKNHSVEKEVIEECFAWVTHFNKSSEDEKRY
jgi:isopenicillin N synthase-like dioxygenase